MASHTSLSAASDDRKARLANLRNLKRKQPTDETVAPESTKSPPPPEHQQAQQQEQEQEQEPDVTKLHLSGRNYDPETKGPKLGFDAPPTLSLDQPTLEEQAAKVEAEVRKRAEEDARDDKGMDLFKLQPKKPNWDLKRDLDKKLAPLNVQTDNAIARLVRDRITAQQQQNTSGKGNVDGASSVGMDGVALVEGLRMREREEEEEERREREEQEEVV